MKGHPDPLQCCLRCYAKHVSDPFEGRRMIACLKCGNKRCPKATDHNNDCTGSNDPGQPGSAF